MLPKPNHDITGGLAVPVMPGWAYVKGLEDSPIWEFVSRQPGASVVFADGREALFAPLERDGQLWGAFATNIPRYITQLQQAAEASLGNIFVQSNSQLPNPQYLDALRRIRFLRDETATLQPIQGTGGVSVFTDGAGHLGGSSRPPGIEPNIGLQQDPFPVPQTTMHGMEELQNTERPNVPGSLAATLAAMRGAAA